MRRVGKIGWLSFAAVLLMLFSAPISGQDGIAQQPAENQPVEQDKSVKEIVIEHISDSYEWHITKIGEKDIAIPLPVILHSKATGWNFFSSSKFHGGAEYNGFKIASEGKYKGKVVEIQQDGSEVRPLDMSLTKTALALMIGSVIVVIIILSAARWYKHHDAIDEAPKGFVGLIEMLVMSVVDGIIEPCIGKNYMKFTPYLLTVFFFIFINNILGLIPIFPAGGNVTGNISITLVLAVATFLAVNIFGTKAYWKDILWPNVPVWLKAPAPIMPLIEIVGMFTKPFALMIRLFANIMAGHSVILIITCIIFVTAKLGAAVNGSMTAISLVLTIFMSFLELLVAYIQAYVFTMMSSVFIGLAQETEEEEIKKHSEKINITIKH